ncbi:hypothetical protein BGZ93_009785 [Podila epicladia]|nr:hypothetical protein BGZ92_001630 [Podila epicladia]KAG0089581.1 hypothetical protein BGZ93_009785 [Podila epicladia]
METEEQIILEEKMRRLDRETHLSPDDYMNYARHDVFDNLMFKDDLLLEHRASLLAFTQEIKSTVDSNFQLLEKIISAKIGKAMGQQSDWLKDLSITLDQHNLAFSCTIQ